MAHIVSTSQPPNGALGDEWFNPTTNKLFKLVALGGTNVSWQDGGNIISGTSGGTATATSASVVAALSAGQAIPSSLIVIGILTFFSDRYVSL